MDVAGEDRNEVYLCPLYGWNSKGVVLSNNIQIRRIDYLAGEQQLIKRTGLNPIKYSYLLEIKSIKSLDYALLGIEHIAKQVEQALRVFSSGEVGLATVFESSNPELGKLYTSKSVNSTSGYKVVNHGLEKFSEFYKKFEKAYGKLPLAFVHFSDMYSKNSAIDKTIYLCIVFEALFVPAEAFGEKFIFVKQGLKILGFSEEEIGNIGVLYKFRNAILHANLKQQFKLLGANKTSSKRYTLSWFREVEDIARRALQIYVASPW